MGTLKGTYKRASDVHVSGQGIWDAGLSSRLRRTDVRVRAAPRGLCGRYGFWAGLLLRGGGGSSPSPPPAVVRVVGGAEEDFWSKMTGVEGTREYF